MKQISSETGICFFRVEKSQTDLRQFLGHIDVHPLAIETSQALVDWWLNRGCVYVDGKRQRHDLMLNENQVIRLHTRPKNYGPIQFPLHERVITENEYFLVLDKPSGLPTHPTLDNYLENAKVRLEGELGIPLYTTHRLDIPTQGLLILAKTSEAQVKINRLFSLRRVEKVYRSINSRGVPLGLLTHYMDPNSRVPKIVTSKNTAGWWTCQLRVDHSRECESGFAHEMNLLTGKTHQIRAQMSSLGAPVNGDSVYGSEHAGELQLECFRMSFSLRGQAYTVERPQSLVPGGFHG